MSRYEMARDRPGDFQTNPWALDVLVPHLNPAWTIWECAAGIGMLSDSLVERGFRVIESDVNPNYRAEVHSFLDWQPRGDTPWGCIITNPPFSLKDQFLARCYELGKPFALLLPLTALEGVKRQQLYKAHGLEIVFLPRRPEFVTPSQLKGAGKNSGSWFAAAWFTWGLEIGSQLVFNPPESTGGRRPARRGRLRERTIEASLF